MTTRADMVRDLQLSPSAPTKSFVLEVHTQNPVGYLEELVDDNRVEHTEDAFLFKVHTPAGYFWVDQLDERFWTFHTDMPMRDAFPFLRDRVESRRQVDWMWLPSEHLRQVWPGAAVRQVRTDFQSGRFVGEAAARDLKVKLSGNEAEALLDVIAQDPRYRYAVSFDSVQAYVVDPEIGSINEGLNRMGRFAASGSSPELHLMFVRSIIQRYRKIVELCEAQAIGWHPLEGADGRYDGASLTGGPVAIELSRTIGDLRAFVDEMFGARLPFRLWGVPEIGQEVAEVEAVDLHVGQRLRFDIGRRWIRVYLESGSCGNTVARLISNLQHRFDGALRLVDPELQEAISGQSQRSPATPCSPR